MQPLLPDPSDSEITLVTSQGPADDGWGAATWANPSLALLSNSKASVKIMEKTTMSKPTAPLSSSVTSARVGSMFTSDALFVWQKLTIRRIGA